MLAASGSPSDMRDSSVSFGIVRCRFVNTAGCSLPSVDAVVG